MGHFFTRFYQSFRATLVLVLLATAFAASAQVTVSATSTNVTCFGFNDGTATAIGSGGWAPYTYLWNTGATTATITNLAPGSYTVTVTDIDLAFGVATVNVTEPTPLGVVTYSQAQICDIVPDGYAVAVPSGGTAPYTYQWSNGGTSAQINGLTAGTYTVTVTDANSCTTVGSVNVLIFGNEGIWIGDSTIHVTCFGANNGMAIAMPMSGTPPYVYQWSNGDTTMKITNLAPGPYTVTVTDINGCSGTWPFLVTEPTDLVTNVGTTPADCGSTGTATVTPTGGTSPYSIVWSNGLTGFTITSLAPGTYTATVTDANGCTEGATVTVTGSGQSLTVNGSVQAPAGCNIGGSATVSITNGSGQYSYLWSANGQTTAVATNLPVGNHTVTVTDLVTGCTGVGTVNIPLAQPIITTVVITTNATCSTGGTATADATGGVPPYTFGWSNGQTGPTATNLAAGTYTVTVTDATGCVGTASATVIQTPGPSVTAQVLSNGTCTTGGSAIATATGGASPYLYLWSNGETTATAVNLPNGVSGVSVTDNNGCVASASVTIVKPSAPTVSAAVTAAATCLTGGSATATASGGTSPYTYAWSNGATTASVTNLAPGTYTVTVTDANLCTGTATTVVAPPVNPTVQITASSVANCNQPGSATALASGASGPYTYVWSNGETTATAVNLPAGTYTVTATASNGCTATTTVTIGQSATGIQIGDFVWYDNDQDGFQATPELNQGVNGVTVKLITAGPNGTFGNADDVVVATTTTNSTGYYLFDCVTPNTYVIQFSNIPSGYQFTSKDAVNNDCKDSDAGANGYTSPFTIVQGQGNNFCFDAGIHTICIPLIYPGTICCDQTICEGETPALLTEATPPFGGSGALEYLWMEFKQIGQAPPAWIGISGANSISYQPGPLFQTSYFMRCVRRAGCEDFLETNIVTITVLPAGSPECFGFTNNLSLKPFGPTGVSIEWITGPETEQYMYTIQHGTDNQNWTDIAEISGKQNANAPNAYSYVDQTPSNGINYYRIMRINNNGLLAYSDARDISIALGLDNQVTVYPNPVHQTLYIKNLVKSDTDGEVTLTSVNGDILQTVVLNKGTIEVKDLAMEHLPSGMYFVRVRFGNGEVKTVKVTKM